MKEAAPRNASFQHASLASGRWRELDLLEQLANVGSEVERSLAWAAKNKPEVSWTALERALELIDLTLADPKHRIKPGRLKELARLREVLLDYFVGGNEFGSSEAAWRSYFGAFAMAVALRRAPAEMRAPAESPEERCEPGPGRS